MTQVVDVDTFPTLEAKAKEYGYTSVRVCEECYDKLANELQTEGSQSHLHPMFRQGVDSEGTTKE